MNDTVAVILAGGKSRRFGSDKLKQIIDGKPLLNRAVEIAANHFQDVFISGTPETDIPGIKQIPDLINDAGPIGGLYSSMKQIPADNFFLIAGDMPFIQPGAIQLLRDSFQPGLDITVAQSERGLEPLFSIYNRRILPVLETQIRERKYALHALYNLVPINVVNFDIHGYISEIFFNINMQHDLTVAKNILINKSERYGG